MNWYCIELGTRRFYGNSAAGSFKSLLQSCDRISNRISPNIFQDPAIALRWNLQCLPFLYRRRLNHHTAHLDCVIQVLQLVCHLASSRTLLERIDQNGLYLSKQLAHSPPILDDPLRYLKYITYELFTYLLCRKRFSLSEKGLRDSKGESWT
jgi:hypothetical protein